MLRGGVARLAALACAGLHVASAAAPPAPVSCGCAQFAPDAPRPVANPSLLSDEARALRDFVLYSHRRIGADLIRKQGPYLATLTAAFPHCSDPAIKHAWLRQIFASTSETHLVAERVALQAESSRACPAELL